MLRSRRFLPLFLVQALGALNDNLFKNALVVLIVFSGSGSAASLVAATGGVFILPYLLVSAFAGQLADRFAKPGLIRLTKWGELALMAVGAAGFVTGDMILLLVVLFGLGVQAAFFGPLKYGILPELLAENEVVRGNALVEAGTFVAILAGTILGGALMTGPWGGRIVAAAGLAAAAAGLAASYAVPAREAAAPALALRWGGTLALLRRARRDRAIWISVLGLSWFWALGATFLAQFPVLAQGAFHADNRVVTLLLAAFVLGIGVGSLAAPPLARRWTASALVPGAATALSACGAGFVLLAGGPEAASWTTPGAMAGSTAGLGALACLVGTAACGGVYSVPLYAALQLRAAPGERARMVAANNLMNAVFMVTAAGVLAGLAALGLRPGTILALTSGANVVAAVLMWRALRRPVAVPGRLGHENA